jgi:hypothetical protein
MFALLEPIVDWGSSSGGWDEKLHVKKQFVTWVFQAFFFKRVDAIFFS